MKKLHIPESHVQSTSTDLAQVIKLANFAVGGQGGGVLNSWIIHLAQNNDYEVQATSVAGVAQRTGATIYYVEMMPKSGRQPVFSLSPSEDDIDILLAAELMEAGRAVIRRFITPGKTRVITSTHRQLATIEKMVPGDGIADSSAVVQALIDICPDLIAFDMQKIAEDEGTVVSAVQFGALAGSGNLPFSVESFRQTVRSSGRGVERSLAAFDRGYDIASGRAKAGANFTASAITSEIKTPIGHPALIHVWAKLGDRIAKLPQPVREMTFAGLAKVVSFQDLEYGETFLTRIEGLVKLDANAGGQPYDYAFSTTAAKYLANAMAYDDIIRVADSKTASGRFARIEAEVRAGPNHLLRVTEYTHPGAAEIISLMPMILGRWLEARDWAVRGIDRLFNRGRHIRTDRLSGFISLYLLAGLRPWRRRLLRHHSEMAHIQTWLDHSTSRLSHDYDYGVQTLCIRRLVKGYSDTHSRGIAKFDRVMQGSAQLEGRSDAADWTNRLILAALQDPEGQALDGAIATITSFTSA